MFRGGGPPKCPSPQSEPRKGSAPFLGHFRPLGPSGAGWSPLGSKLGPVGAVGQPPTGTPKDLGANSRLEGCRGLFHVGLRSKKEGSCPKYSDLGCLLAADWCVLKSHPYLRPLLQSRKPKSRKRLDDPLPRPRPSLLHPQRHHIRSQPFCPSQPPTVVQAGSRPALTPTTKSCTRAATTSGSRPLRR